MEDTARSVAAGESPCGDTAAAGARTADSRVTEKTFRIGASALAWFELGSGLAKGERRRSARDYHEEK